MRAAFLVLTVSLLSDSVPCSAKEGTRGVASVQVFGLDKVWSMHLTLQPDQWEKMQPKHGQGGFGFPPAPAPKGNSKEGNPAEPKRDANKRGMFVFDFPYVKGDLEIEDRTFKDGGHAIGGVGYYVCHRSACCQRSAQSGGGIEPYRWRARCGVEEQYLARA